jgi:hypothetical protein
LKHFDSIYGEKPTKNKEIVEMVRKNYSESNNLEELIEWVHYVEFKQITSIGDKSSKLYKAIRPNGFIDHLDYNRLAWIRVKDANVMLKSFDKLEDLLKEVGSFFIYLFCLFF